MQNNKKTMLTSGITLFFKYLNKEESLELHWVHQGVHLHILLKDQFHLFFLLLRGWVFY